MIRILATIGLLLASLAPLAGLTAPPPARAQGLLQPAPPTLTPDHRDAVYGNFLQAGNSVLRCPVEGEVTGGNTPADCLAATADELPGGLLDNRSNNNGYYLHQADDDGRADSFNSSRAELTIPAGATVRHAQLHWGGHTGTFVGFSGVNCMRPILLQGQPPPPPAAASPAQQQVRLAVAGGAPVTVQRVPEHYRTTEGLAEPSQIYTDWADVTALFDGAPSGERFEVAVSNVWAPSGPGCAGGWSLVVVFGHDAPTAEYPTLRVVSLYTDNLPKGGALLPGLIEPLVPGFPSIIDGLLPELLPGLTGTSVILPGVNPRRAGAGIEIGLTAYDGDRHQGGETLTVDGEPVTDPCRNDTTEDFFRSCGNYAIDPLDPARRPINNLSVDAKTFIPELADNDTGEIELGVNSVADFVVLQNVVVAESIDPAVSVTNTGPTEPVRQGDLATFDIEITNSGALPLFDIELADTSDPPSEDIRCAPTVVPPLDPGESRTVTCLQPAGPTDFVNTATVTAAYLVGGDGEPRTVTAADTAEVTVEEADYAVERVPDRLVARPGEPVTFAVTLINNTDRVLTDVSYTDEVAADCAGLARPDLAPAGTDSFECATTAPAESFTSNGSMTGTDEDQSTVTVTSQSVTVTVIEPTLTVELAVDKDTVYRGDTVELTFTVANTGDGEDEALSDVVVTVDALPDCEPDAVDELPPGESATVTCTVSPQETVDAEASAIAVDVGGQPVTAVSEPVTVTVLDPLLSLAQSAEPTTVRTGGEVTFTFTATHIGDEEDGPVSDVRITNPTIPPDCEPEVIDELAPGASASRSCTAAPDRSFDSVALASAVDRFDRPMEVAAEPLRITVINPAMTISTAVDPEQAKHGADVDFTVTVRNIGDVALGLEVGNDQAGDCDFTIDGDGEGLRPGAAHGRRCTTETPTDAGEESFTNTAEFTASPVESVEDDGDPITGSDDATVTLLDGQAPPDPTPGPDPDDPGNGDNGGSSGGGGGGGSAGGGSQGGSLPETGSSIAVPLALATGMLVTGGLMLAVAARRPDDEDSFLARWWFTN